MGTTIDVVNCLEDGNSANEGMLHCEMNIAWYMFGACQRLRTQSNFSTSLRDNKRRHNFGDVIYKHLNRLCTCNCRFRCSGRSYNFFNSIDPSKAIVKIDRKGSKQKYRFKMRLQATLIGLLVGCFHLFPSSGGLAHSRNVTGIDCQRMQPCKRKERKTAAELSSR